MSYSPPIKGRGVNVAMIGTGDGGGIRSVIENLRSSQLRNYTVVRLCSHETGGRTRRFLFALRAQCSVVRMCARKSVDVVHCHVSMNGSFWRKACYCVTARAFRVPTILHLHGSQFGEFYDALPVFLKALVRAIIRNVDLVIVLSRSSRDFIRSICSEARVEVVRNFVPVQSDEAMAPCDQCCALFIGLVGPRKGIYDLLVAFSNIADDVPNARLTIAGAGRLTPSEKLGGDSRSPRSRNVYRLG